MRAFADRAGHALAGSQWRNARSIEKLRKQVDAAFPGQNTRNDGTFGDEKHQTRNSDHNPWVRDGNMGVVTAIDITHDPGHGCDANVITANLLKGKDVRIKYIIWNRKIVASYPVGTQPAWKWRRTTRTARRCGGRGRGGGSPT